MGYIPPPMRVLPPGATKEEREKLYWERRAELLAARDYNSRMAGSGLAYVAIAVVATMALLFIFKIIP